VSWTSLVLRTLWISSPPLAPHGGGWKLGATIAQVVPLPPRPRGGRWSHLRPRPDFPPAPEIGGRGLEEGEKFGPRRWCYCHVVARMLCARWKFVPACSPPQRLLECICFAVARCASRPSIHVVMHPASSAHGSNAFPSSLHNNQHVDVQAIPSTY
jgi:hypothetical protein